MITLITYDEFWHYDSNGSKRCKRDVPIRMVSHGVDDFTERDVVLENAPLQHYISIGVVFNKDTGEWEI